MKENNVYKLNPYANDFIPKYNNNKISLQWKLKLNTWQPPVYYYNRGKIIYGKQKYEKNYKKKYNKKNKKIWKTKTLFLTTQVKDTGMVSKKRSVNPDQNSYFSLLLFSLILSAIILAAILGFMYLQIGNLRLKMYSALELASFEDTYSNLIDLRNNNKNRLIFGHLNINSIRNKIEMLSNIIVGKLDILLLSETKIDDSFLTGQFHIPGFSTPYRSNRSNHGGGLLLYTRNDIPSKLLSKFIMPNNVECIFIEINIYKKKWLVGGSYNPNKSNSIEYLNVLGKYIDEYLINYDNIILLGDFNIQPTELEMINFCSIYNLKNLVNEFTCFKNQENPSCVDLILTNKPRSFQNTRIIETGLSDFHKMTVTVLKTIFTKLPPKTVSYRDYKHFSHQIFRNEVIEKLAEKEIIEINYEHFENIIIQCLNLHAPIKKKYIRANDSPFMTKDLRKAIMVRSRLKNKYNKIKTEENRLNYNMQRNKCTSLLRKAKKNYFNKLNPSLLNDNKKIWKIVKPLFSEKYFNRENITLDENNEIIEDDTEISEIFNKFFANAIKDFNIEIDPNILNNVEHIKDPILKAIKKYERHPSIIKINECNLHAMEIFNFERITEDNVLNEINALDTKKATQINSIPINVIKDNSDIFSFILFNIINRSIEFSNFPDKLKLADITPVHKKDNRNDKHNYRPVSILPSISKILERIIYFQINKYFDKKLSKFQCGFRKNFNAQHCLIVMIEKWKSGLDKKLNCGALMTDLSKAFDSLSHELLIAKLHAYGFNNSSLKLIHSYLNNRYQRVRINSKCSTWSQIITGVPQGSILGPLLFNIYLNDMFLFTKGSNIVNYADDSTPYNCSNDINGVIEKLEDDSKILISWFSNNALKANPDKFHMLLSNTDVNIKMKIDNYEIQNSKHKKLLGITIDNKMKFEEHVSNLCTKASQKLHALARVSAFMNFKQRRIIMKSFINSQFGYCPLVWMFHSRNLNNRINKIHERALRLVYNDNISSFEDLLIKDNSVSIHKKNIQMLAIELYKVKNNIGPEILKDVFKLKEENRYCSNFTFKTKNVRTVTYGTESLSFLGPKIWSLIPDEIKNVDTLGEFKNKIKKWKILKCPCRICKTYIQNIGFI